MRQMTLAQSGAPGRVSETTESTSVFSYLDLLSTREKSDNITTKLYDKRDDLSSTL